MAPCVCDMLNAIPDCLNNVRAFVSEPYNKQAIKEYKDFQRYMYVAESETMTVEEVQTIMNVYRLNPDFMFTKECTAVVKMMEALDYLFIVDDDNDFDVSASRISRVNEDMAVALNKIVVKNEGIFRSEHAVSKGKNAFEYVHLAPTLIQEKLRKLFQHTRNEIINAQSLLPEFEERDNKIIDIAISFFSDFMFIRPFADGNGRVARLMFAYILAFISPIPVSLITISTEDYDRALYESHVLSTGIDLNALFITSIHRTLNTFIKSLNLDK